MDVLASAPDRSIGQRVTYWRKQQGIPQWELADQVGISQSQVCRIETGARSVRERSLLHALAESLGVSVSDLTGQPLPPVTRAQRVAHSTVPAIRRTLDGVPDGLTPRPPEHLAVLADYATTVWVRGDWTPYCHIVPELLAETRLLAADGHALDVAVQVHTVASWMVRTLGYEDLARLLVHEAGAYAQRAGRPELEAATAFFLSGGVLEGGNQRRAYQLVDDAARLLEPVADDPVVCGWLVMLHLQAAFVAGSLHLPAEAVTHLAEAAELAGRPTADPWHMEPTPGNVGVWRVGVALENGDPEGAPDLARRVDRDSLSVGRLSRLAFDAGRGWHARGDSRRCVEHMLEADRLYPLGLWTQPPVREVVGQMARDSRGRTAPPGLDVLCRKVGIDPAVPPEQVT